MWTHFHHEADIGVRGIGQTHEEAFEEAAMALTAVITDPASVACSDTVTVDCEAPDPELLLVDWLNALVFEMATRKMLFSRFHVEFKGTHLHAPPVANLSTWPATNLQRRSRAQPIPNWKCMKTGR